MQRVLVVDDSAVDRTRVGRLLEKDTGLHVSYAVDGRSALEQIQQLIPDLILTDLQMPEVNGLQLVEAIKREYPSIPVILMTARGSEDIAAEALRKGAASYVPKAQLADQLREAVNRILAASRADRGHSRLMHSLESARLKFRLRNDLELIDPLVGQLQEMLRCLPLADEAERLRVGVALKHALLIAQRHGNLELPIEPGRTDAELAAIAAERQFSAPYCHRALVVEAAISPEKAEFLLAYEGPPIDVSQLPADASSIAADQAWLGEFLMLRSIMSNVQFAPSRPELALIRLPMTSESADDLEISIAD